MVERQPEGPELRLVPARADAEHEAPAADLVDRGGHARDQARRVEPEARHERPDHDALGHAGQRGHDRPRVPRPALRAALVAVEQVIAEPDRVEPDLLGGARHGDSYSGQRTTALDLGQLTPTRRGRGIGGTLRQGRAIARL